MRMFAGTRSSTRAKPLRTKFLQMWIDALHGIHTELAYEAHPQ
jgi:hypothetical protein